MSVFIPDPPASAFLAANRAATTAFINQIPLTVVLTPRAKVKQPGGGYILQEGTPRAAQVVSLVESPGEPLPTVTLDGVERVVTFEMVGQWDAEMAVHDVFDHQGKAWEVVELFYDNGYETRALVSGRG